MRLRHVGRRAREATGGGLRNLAGQFSTTSTELCNQRSTLAVVGK